ncbi:YdhK family protein [Lysinibacillus sp. NPDC097287]|uniref:YdhK family protein n=1 Tax=Lysinibacillus sp. NPDC097287 TaxID=3364144 RepID=UPI00381FC8CC
MKLQSKWHAGLLTVVAALALSACSEEPSETNKENTTEQKTEMDHSTMNHSSSGDVPETLKNAENPMFPVGSTAIITDGHMDGMKGAEATIVGAYDTTAYMISYEPTTGGDRVEKHKWVIHEELIDAGDVPVTPGTEVKTDASHMEGMENAKVVIDEAIQTTVYMIDYVSTTDGEAVKNHQWVTESELAPVK